MNSICPKCTAKPIAGQCLFIKMLQFSRSESVSAGLPDFVYIPDETVADLAPLDLRPLKNCAVRQPYLPIGASKHVDGTRIAMGLDRLGKVGIDAGRDLCKFDVPRCPGRFDLPLARRHSD